MINNEATLALVTRVENELNTRDLDALMADMAEDCRFDHGAAANASFGRHEGAAAVRAVWASLDSHFPGLTQEIADRIATGDRPDTKEAP
jgi:hypothetical protein